MTEYFKAFIDMRSNRKVRKACKEYIVGMESEADSLQGIGYPGTFIIGSNLLSLTSHTIGIYRSLV